jgi:hypothetical protein
MKETEIRQIVDSGIYYVPHINVHDEILQNPGCSVFVDMAFDGSLCSEEYILIHAIFRKRVASPFEHTQLYYILFMLTARPILIQGILSFQG